MNDTAPTTYAVQVRGHLADRWSTHLDGFALTRNPDGTTTLTGRPVDQAALHGLLRKVRDLGLALLSVAPVPDDHDAPSDTTTSGSPS